MSNTADIVICGAGIAGVSAAYFLAVHHGVRDILLVDERPPLSLTSDKSTECYRNWWPGPGDEMVALMNQSIDLLEELALESDNIFHLNRRGYLYLTADKESLVDFERAAAEPASLGAGSLRIYHGTQSDPEYLPAPPKGYRDLPTGADLFLDPKLIQEHFPYLSDKTIGALHVRRAGWLSGQQLGMYLLERGRVHGVKTTNARVTGIIQSKNKVQSVQLDNGEIVTTRSFVNAAGPLIQQVGKMLDVDLPVYNQLHLKVSFRDLNGVVPRATPLLIWNDPQVLPWNDEEMQWLAEDADSSWLLEPLPGGAHTRPDGGPDSDIILLLWDFHGASGANIYPADPVFPPPLDEVYPEIALRGMAAMLPAFQEYFERIPRPMLDGGYYTRTSENRPLIGPLPVEGAYIIGALSGYGIMAACGAGELLASQIAGSEIPSYSEAFSLNRYHDPTYMKLLENWDDRGQL